MICNGRGLRAVVEHTLYSLNSSTPIWSEKERCGHVSFSMKGRLTRVLETRGFKAQKSCN